jgi:hypothetical protein
MEDVSLKGTSEEESAALDVGDPRPGGVNVIGLMPLLN